MIKNRYRLDDLDERLILLCEETSLIVPIIVDEGMRDRYRQAYLVKTKKSKTLNSRHLTGHAVDLRPLSFEGWGDIAKDMNFTQELVLNITKERGQFYFLAGVMKAIAKRHKIPYRWLGDSDGDGKFKDQTFDDLVHHEIPLIGGE